MSELLAVFRRTCSSGSVKVVKKRSGSLPNRAAIAVDKELNDFGKSFMHHVQSNYQIRVA